jgi:hypothetical protein
MTCQETPNLSVSQPHGPSAPPSVSLAHRSSTSSCVSQLTNSEMPWSNLKLGPP